jgi:Flp pilus assembly protein TadG
VPHLPAPVVRRWRGDRGDGVVALILATGIVLALVVQIINVVVFTYGKGSVRNALDEAARAGARQGVAACEAVGGQVLHDLLGGSMANGVTISCVDIGQSITATATVHFDGWMTSLADYDTTFSASAAKEDR